MRTLLPLYVHPVDDPAAWTAVSRAAADVTVIVNIHDGPGAWPDPVYAGVTESLRAAGVPMLGYVDLDYGERDRDAIWRDLRIWRRYPVCGVFFDQAPSGPERAPGVGVVVSAARRSGLSTVVLNPGTRPHRYYAGFADTICTFEGPWDSYARRPAEPDWPHAAHLVYGAPAGRVVEVTRRMAGQVTTGLITERSAPLPYAGLPAALADRR
jgi:hypothetical protein